MTLVKVPYVSNNIHTVTLKLDDDDFETLNDASFNFAQKNGIKENRSNYLRHLIRSAK